VYFNRVSERSGEGKGNVAGNEDDEKRMWQGPLNLKILGRNVIKRRKKQEAFSEEDPGRSSGKIYFLPRGGLSRHIKRQQKIKKGMVLTKEAMGKKGGRVAATSPIGADLGQERDQVKLKEWGSGKKGQPAYKRGERGKKQKFYPTRREPQIT